MFFLQHMEVFLSNFSYIQKLRYSNGGFLVLVFSYVENRVFLLRFDRLVKFRSNHMFILILIYLKKLHALLRILQCSLVSFSLLFYRLLCIQIITLFRARWLGLFLLRMRITCFLSFYRILLFNLKLMSFGQIGLFFRFLGYLGLFFRLN